MAIGFEPMDRYELRFQDYALTEEQDALRELLARFLSRHCPAAVVRGSQPLGFDRELWEQFVKLGVLEMSVPAEVGGDGAGLVELAVVAEEVGRRIAPLPYITHAVATRVLGATVGADHALAGALAATEPITLALHPCGAGGRQLVPDAAVARHVLALVGDQLVLHSGPEPAAHIPNQGGTPLAWWSPSDAATRRVLATGARAKEVHERAVAEWKLLTAGALVGLTDAALDLAVEFARTRQTLGVPIGALQGVSFPLADVAINIAGTRNLIRRAAWFADHEPGERPELPAVALAAAARTATHGAETAVHVHGGLGVSTEADVSLYFLRAKAWSVLGGDRLDDDIAIGRQLLKPPAAR
jgi:alkylation response protein AidB-like acyl-CoA dehydrogenase